MEATLEHVDIPWRDLSAEFAELVFQLVDLVLEVVDVQVLRADRELVHGGLRQCRQRAGTERRHHHHHYSSPHHALSLVCCCSYNDVTAMMRGRASTQLTTETLRYCL